jgi:hypothetical protein
MDAELKCTEPERWTIVPDSEAADDEIVAYLDHVERCPFHSTLENRELQFVKKDFQTARELAPDRQLPLSLAAQNKVLDEFEQYLAAPKETGVYAAKPSRTSRRKRNWFPSFKQAVFATSIIVVVAFSVAIWKVMRRAPAPASAPPSGGSEIVGASPSPPPPSIAIKDAGGIIELDYEGNLSGLPPDVSDTNREAINQALKEAKVRVSPIPREVQTRSEQRMGAKDSATLSLLSPVQRVVVSSNPIFRWDSLKGATGYTVSIYDSKGSLVTSSNSLKTTSWTLPEAKRLTRGRVYSWEVTATKDDEKISSQAKFKVLEESKANEVADARKQHPGFHLLLGIVYARVGLLDEAENEFQIVLHENPQSDVAQRLVQSVRSRRLKR